MGFNGVSKSVWNSHDDFDTLSNPVTCIYVFYYSLIISCVFCANYKVGEGFEFSREELGVKDEQQIDLRFQALRVLKFQAWRFSCAFIVDFSDLIRKMYVEKKRDLEFCTDVRQTSIVKGEWYPYTTS